MKNELNNSDLDQILVSLSYSKQRIESSQDHPSYEFKRNELNKIDDLIDKVRKLRNK